jgi:GntR family transcriptional regulator/MocR family aminotransferase
MRKIASGFAPVIPLDRNAKKPLHRQIYEGYRKAILERHLRAGQQIPSTRALALELGISRIPLLNAYSQLLAEGFFESRAGAGTFVANLPPDPVVRAQSRPVARANAQSGRRPVSRRSQLLPSFQPAPWIYGSGAFSVGQVAVEHFPVDTWSRLIARHSRRLHAKSAHFNDPRGYREFRQAVAEYLQTARAVKCDEQQIMIVSGSQEALDLSARVLLDPGSPVWIEEPGYWLARRVLTLAGCELVPVPVDRDGLDVAAGMKLCRTARAAYVTPSHQFPLGVTMSASRRLQLLNWAQSCGAWIIEDDYDSEYRYGVTPIASLQGLDTNARVIYVGTFSKTLLPSLRVGYLVMPADLADRFMAVRVAMDIYPPHVNQAVLTDFINDGHFSRHIRRTRLLYAERREQLVQCLHNEFGSRLELMGTEAGVHLAVTLPAAIRDRPLCERAAREKLWLWPLSPCYMGKVSSRQGFILGFGSVAAGEIPQAIRRMAAVLRPEMDARGPSDPSRRTSAPGSNEV